MTDVAKSVKRIANCTPSTIPPEVFDASEPVLLEGLVGDWPAVRGCGGLAEAGQYLKPYFTEHPVTAYIGPPSIGGRFFITMNSLVSIFAAVQRLLSRCYCGLLSSK